MSKLSAGLLMFRMKDSGPEILLVHPGGPFWSKKDDGAWSIPKGFVKEGEDTLEGAKREFEEETGLKPEGNFRYLTNVKGNGKSVEVWMFEGDMDVSKLKSGTVIINWPPITGKKMEIPEVDRGEFFSLEEAKNKLVKYQLPLIDAFKKEIKKPA